MNFCTRLWKFCAGYFFLLSFLLARTSTSSPTGSDDFILLLYCHIVHYLIKLGQKIRNVENVFPQKVFWMNFLKLNHRLRSSNWETLCFKKWSDSKNYSDMSLNIFLRRKVWLRQNFGSKCNSWYIKKTQGWLIVGWKLTK